MATTTTATSTKKRRNSNLLLNSNPPPKPIPDSFFRRLLGDECLKDSTGSRVDACNGINTDDWKQTDVTELNFEGAMNLFSSIFELNKFTVHENIQIFIDKNTKINWERPADYNLIGIDENPRVVFGFSETPRVFFSTGYHFCKVEKKEEAKGKEEAKSLSEYAYVVWKQLNVYLPKDPSFEIPKALLDFLGEFLKVDDVPVVYLQVAPSEIDVPLNELTVLKLLELVSTESVTMKSSYDKNMNIVELQPYFYFDLANIIVDYV